MVGWLEVVGEGLAGFYARRLKTIMPKYKRARRWGIVVAIK
jgi:hypothetical protein